MTATATQIEVFLHESRKAGSYVTIAWAYPTSDIAIQHKMEDGGWAVEVNRPNDPYMKKCLSVHESKELAAEAAILTNLPIAGITLRFYGKVIGEVAEGIQERVKQSVLTG